MSTIVYIILCIYICTVTSVGIKARKKMLVNPHLGHCHVRTLREPCGAMHDQCSGAHGLKWAWLCRPTLWDELSRWDARPKKTIRKCARFSGYPQGSLHQKTPETEQKWDFTHRPGDVTEGMLATAEMRMATAAIFIFNPLRVPMLNQTVFQWANINSGMASRMTGKLSIRSTSLFLRWSKVFSD